MTTFFNISVDDAGIATVTFSRPPVNAIGAEVYHELLDVCTRLDAMDDARVVILIAPPDNRAWCAGADLKQISSGAAEGRAARYEIINRALPALFNLGKPLIGAINGHCLGMGMVWASLCDIRIAADDAQFSLPEIERGMGAPIGVFLSRLNLPTGVIRELLLTGRKFSAAELYRCGFLNYAVPRQDVLAKSLEIASAMAKHRLAALRATKAVANASEAQDWMKAYKMGQEYSVDLARHSDAREGLDAFLEKRSAVFKGD